MSSTDYNYFKTETIFSHFVKILKIQIQQLQNSKDTQKTVNLLSVLKAIRITADSLISIMDEGEPKDLLYDINKQLDEITSELRWYKAKDVRPSLNEKVAALKLQQFDFMNLLCSIPVNEATQEKITLLREKMKQIATLSRESGSIQGELTLAEQMTNMVSLLKCVTDRLAMNKHVPWIDPPSAEDSSWRRLATSPHDSAHEDSFKPISDNAGSHDDSQGEDSKSGRKRNRLKRNGRRKEKGLTAESTRQKGTSLDQTPQSLSNGQSSLPGTRNGSPLQEFLSQESSNISDKDSSISPTASLSISKESGSSVHSNASKQSKDGKRSSNSSRLWSMVRKQPNTETSQNASVPMSPVKVESMPSNINNRTEANVNSRGTQTSVPTNTDISAIDGSSFEVSPEEIKASQDDSVLSFLASSSQDYINEEADVDQNQSEEFMDSLQYQNMSNCEQAPQQFGKISMQDVDSGMVPDMSEDMSASRFGVQNVSGSVSRSSGGLMHGTSANAVPSSACRSSGMSVGTDPASEFGVQNMSGSESRFDSVSNQNVSSVSSYAPLFPGNDQSNLSNLFDGLEIRLTPSETSLHSFSSFYSDNKDYKCFGNGYRHWEPSSVQENQQECQPSNSFPPELVVQTSETFLSDVSGALQSVSQISPQDSYTDAQSPAWTPIESSSSYAGSQVSKVTSSYAGSQVSKMTSSYAGSQVSKMTSSSVKSIGSSSSAYLEPTSDSSGQWLLVGSALLVVATVACIYFKFSGLSELLEYYSLWEVLSGHVDVTKTGESLF